MISENNLRIHDKQFSSNLQNFLKELSDVIKDATKSEISRSLAAIQLKNSIYSKDEYIKIEHQERWSRLPEDARDCIKNNCFESFKIESKRPSQVAQFVGYISCAELSRGLWPNCISDLLTKLSSKDSNEHLKESCLEVIGYICYETKKETLKPHISQLLKIIFDCFDKEKNDNLKQYAINILNESPNFIRDFYMEKGKSIEKVILKSIEESMNENVRLCGLKCLEKIIENFYLKFKIDNSLIEYTIKTVNSKNTEISLQSICIWIAILKHETKTLNFNDKEDEFKNAFKQRHLLESFKNLVPLLLENLNGQRDNEDDEEWTPYKASAICLMFLSNYIQDDFYDMIQWFINKNLEEADWYKKDAALIACGSLLKLKSFRIIKNIVDNKIDIFNNFLQETNELLKHTMECFAYSLFKILPEFAIKFKGLKELTESKSFKFSLFNRDLFDFEIKLNKHRKYKIYFNQINNNEKIANPRPVGAFEYSNNADIKKALVNLDELNKAIKNLKHVDSNGIEKNTADYQKAKSNNEEMNTKQTISKLNEKQNSKIYKTFDPVEKETPPFLLVKLRHVNNNNLK